MQKYFAPLDWKLWGRLHEAVHLNGINRVIVLTHNNSKFKRFVRAGCVKAVQI